jgi:hypothetical protein
MARLTILLTILALGGTAASPVPVEREPMHHVVYADKKLRVYDIVIPPHRSTRFHIHYHDLAGVTISPGASRDEQMGSKPVDEPPDKPGEVWFAPHPRRFVHRVSNLGGTAIHMVVVELLAPPSQRNSTVATDGSPGGEVELKNGKVRVVRYVVAPGKSVAAGPGVLVALGRGRINGACGMQGSSSITRAGFVCVGTDLNHSISNVGKRSITLLLFQLLPQDA